MLLPLCLIYEHRRLLRSYPALWLSLSSFRYQQIERVTSSSFCVLYEADRLSENGTDTQLHPMDSMNNLTYVCNEKTKL